MSGSVRGRLVVIMVLVLILAAGIVLGSLRAVRTAPAAPLVAASKSSRPLQPLQGRTEPSRPKDALTTAEAARSGVINSTSTADPQRDAGANEPTRTVWFSAAPRCDPDTVAAIPPSDSSPTASTPVRGTDSGHEGSSADSPTQRALMSIPGAWSGTYHYGDPNGKVEFTMSLTRQGNHFVGTCDEPATFGDGTVPTLHATLIGEVATDGTTVSFLKTYDGTGGVSHSIRYRGTLDGTTISGKWENTGPFEMVQLPKANN